ncbi:hypothetical protein [Methylobacterium sp. Leaf361]|uniref:hypothetical protein n=1 Tax=Methylobacterium sp. Leaf361 TaxID=1736352 RepID=UPI0009E856D5|nr:hypothetical protein [Methylobacterium sp. Leaf361]
MGATFLAEAAVKPQIERRRNNAPQILLAVCWIGLFAYCAAYLTEDLPLPTQSAQAFEEPLIEQVEGFPRQVIGMATPEPPATSSISATAEVPAVEIEPPQPMPEAHLQAPAVAPQPASVVADYVGIWGPTADACGARGRRKGYLPATITPDRAKAGDTVCSFRDAHRAGNAWIMAADCGDHDRRWSTKVRLVVDGDHLTWTSAWGSSAYVRCNRRAG